MKILKSKILQMAAAFFSIIALVAFGLYRYNQSLQDSLAVYSCNTLNEITQQQKYSFVAALDERFSNIKTIAGMLADTTDITAISSKQQIIPLLQDAVLDSGFGLLIFGDLQGNAITNNNRELNLLGVDYFNNAIAGETYLSEPFTPPFDSREVVAFSTPVVVDGTTVGVLVGIYDTLDLGMILTPFFGQTGYAYVCNSKGDIIAKSNIDGELLSGSLMSGVQDMKVVKYDSVENIRDNVSNGQGGHTILIHNDHKKLAHYTPIGINDWFVVSVVRDSIIASQAANITRNMLQLSAGIVILFVCVFSIYVINNRRQEKVLYKAAYIDELTGLPNLAKFKIDAQKVLREHKDQKFMVIKFDIYQFKMVNEMFGFEIGDMIIRMIADTTKTILDGNYTVFARVNADAFVLLDNYHSIEDMDQRRYRAVTAFKHAAAKIIAYKIDFRFGRYSIQPGETDINMILEKVNLAHRIAKEERHIDFFEYDEELKKQLIAEAELESRMEYALENNEFIVFLQPKYQLASEKVIGAEALVRWRHNGEMIAYPNDFIPLFEKNGFVTKLDMYMLDKVCQIIKGWMDQQQQPVTISVNFSRVHLQNDRFVKDVDDIVSRYGIPKKYIEIELTESTIFDNEDMMHNVLSKFHESGYTLTMDDFGTGYSSLGLLKNLPVDVIKMDKAFFTNNKYRSRARIVIESVMQMAKKLGIHTVAEGVETQDHIDFLRTVGCDIVQGYYYAKPVEASQFTLEYKEYPKLDPQPTYEEELSELIQPVLSENDFTLSVYVYRLLYMVLCNALNNMKDEAEMYNLVIESGRSAGATFAEEVLDLHQTADQFYIQLIETFQEAEIDFLKPIDYEQDSGKFVCRIQAANTSKPFYQFYKGFMEGILTQYAGKTYLSKDMDTDTTGSYLCRFEAKEYRI